MYKGSCVQWHNSSYHQSLVLQGWFLCWVYVPSSSSGAMTAADSLASGTSLRPCCLLGLAITCGCTGVNCPAPPEQEPLWKGTSHSQILPTRFISAGATWWRWTPSTGWNCLLGVAEISQESIMLVFFYSKKAKIILEFEGATTMVKLNKLLTCFICSIPEAL